MHFSIFLLKINEFFFVVNWFTQYYLKAKFHFNKDQFADLMIIVGASGSISQVIIKMQTFERLVFFTLFNLQRNVISQLLFMPVLVPALKEERLLSIGLFFGCAHVRTVF